MRFMVSAKIISVVMVIKSGLEYVPLIRSIIALAVRWLSSSAKAYEMWKLVSIKKIDSGDGIRLAGSFLKQRLTYLYWLRFYIFTILFFVGD